jgi:hypothetical protein
MYHSSAILLPNRKVISAGGGHERGDNMVDQTNAEMFEPEYGPPGVTNAPDIGVLGAPTHLSYKSRPEIAYGETGPVLFNNGSSSVVAKDFAIMRLGSATHGFDMGQSFRRLPIIDSPRDISGTLLVTMPATPKEAPPGHYMLFLRTEDGEISEGEYFQLKEGQKMAYLCAATSALDAIETSCTAEPVDGECSVADLQQNLVALPLADGPAGPVEGWHVFVPPGGVRNPLAPSNDELEKLKMRCVSACEGHWAGQGAIGANCNDLDVFYPPQHSYDNAHRAEELILDAQKNGEGIFPSQSLACSLDSSCCSAFDENVCSAVPHRVTPANDLLGVGQEFKVALGSQSSIKVVTGQGTYISGMTGSIGYSFCAGGNALAPCPFYLGSFESVATSALNTTVKCSDNSTARVRIENLFVRLSQPAFGIAEQGTNQKGFPRGALVFESAFDVGGQHFTFRRPSTSDVIITASQASFNATDLTVNLTIPCNGTVGALAVKLTARDPGPTASALGSPPGVTNTTAATGMCGLSRALTAVVSDPNSDAGNLRWKVDGILLAPGTNSMVVTEPHMLEVFVRDARGATTTSQKEISCN